jgi:signal transduction histidine kinase
MLDDLGLVAAIQWQAEEFEKRMGIKCAVALDFDSILAEINEGL